MKKPFEKFEKLGVFKLKDRPNRQSLYIDFSETTHPIEKLKGLVIEKVKGKSSRFVVALEWKK